jgi:hypothetical protein
MAGARPLGCVIPQIAIELACCHLIAMTDMKSTAFSKNDKINKQPTAPLNDAGQVSFLVDNDEERISIGVSHIEMMTKAIKILQREGVDPGLYRFALDDARALPDHKRNRIVIEGKFAEEMIPPEAFKAIINCIMDF